MHPFLLLIEKLYQIICSGDENDIISQSIIRDFKNRIIYITYGTIYEEIGDFFA